jgi:hypothetical protein
VTISRLYDDYSTAQQVVNDLEAAGLSANDISIVASNADNWYKPKTGSKAMARKDKDHDGTDDRVEGAETGASIGAVVGGAAGLLAGLGILAIPGVGPVVAAGWLAATTGGIVGALTQAGISKEDAPVYAEGLRRGGTLVTAKVAESQRSRYEAILNRSAVDIRERAEAYRKSGWTGFDDRAKPYSAEEARRERSTYQPTIR